jgi:histidine kinase
MAHELRQPVTAITNFLTTILDQVETGRTEKIKERLDEYRIRSRRNIDRLSRIIDHLRTFGRQDSLTILPTELRGYIDEIFSTFLDAQLAGDGIAVSKHIPAELPMVEIDRPRMEQVILNLISNARGALEGIEAPKIEIRAEAANGKLRLSVGDNGHGISQEHFDKVLNPFFTTKPVGRGTGIGLSISHGIVKGHQGELHIANNEEGGACFTVEVPITQPKKGDGEPGLPLHSGAGSAP